MVNQVDTEKIILKTKQYEFADGLREIQLGITLILIGAFWNWVVFEPSWVRVLIQLRDDYGKWATIVFFTLTIAIPLFATYGIQRIMEYVRRRWLWRESGMVKSSQMLVPRRFNVAATIVFIGTLVLGFTLQPNLKTGEWFAWSLILVALGWSFGIVLIGLGRNIEISRYVYMGVIGGLASTAILLYQTSYTGAGLVFYMGWGLILLISGSIVLKRAWSKVREKSHAE